VGGDRSYDIAVLARSCVNSNAKTKAR